MAVLKKKKKEQLGEITLSSTSDVAFLLLIFFIVTTIFAAEQGLIMVLPAKQDRTNEPVKVKESNVATVRILADNSVMLDNEVIEINHLKQVIEDKLLANDQLVVVLETHPDASYGLMVACLDELNLARARKISLKTTDN